MAADGANGTVDLRGEFIRGWDNGRGVDSGRALAAWQDGQIQNHTHNVGLANENCFSRYGCFGGWVGWRIIHTQGTGYDSYTSSTGGVETRPRNVALLACMKR